MKYWIIFSSFTNKSGSFPNKDWKRLYYFFPAFCNIFMKHFNIWYIINGFSLIFNWSFQSFNFNPCFKTGYKITWTKSCRDSSLVTIALGFKLPINPPAGFKIPPTSFKLFPIWAATATLVLSTSSYFLSSNSEHLNFPP